MGIPLFVTPIEPEAASKSADKSSARPRSSIRRTRPAGTPRMSPEARRRRLIGRATDFMEEYEVVEPPTQRSAPPRSEDSVSLPHPFSSRALRSEHEQIQRRMRHEHESLITDSPFLPPAPDSEDTRALSEASRRMLPWEREINPILSARQRQDLRRLARRRGAAPTPPFTEGDAGRSARSQREEPDERRSILLPAPSSSRLEPISGFRNNGAESFLNDYIGRYNLTTSRTPDSVSLAERVAALNRATDSFEEASRARQQSFEELTRARQESFEDANLAIQATQDDLAEQHRNARERFAAIERTRFDGSRAYLNGRTRLDGLGGLGDRERSLSPETTTWDTLLSSIPIDPQAPSAGSSFASSAAAVASSGPASAGTSQTSIDAAPAHGTGNAADVCEASDSPSGDEDEDQDMLVPRDSSRRTRATDRPYTDYFGMARAPDLLARFNQSTDTDRYPWEGLQQVIASLTERDDIPESWWASAGLSRNTPREPSI